MLLPWDNQNFTVCNLCVQSSTDPSETVDQRLNWQKPERHTLFIEEISYSQEL